MIERQYDPQKAGREIYIASNGAELERRYIYADSHTWDDLHSLARLVGQPLGKMLISLAYAEIKRIRDSRPLPHASHR